MMGELKHHDMLGSKHDCHFNPEYMAFAEPQGDRTTNSQLVISEAMASCSIDALMQSSLGMVHVSTARLNRMFEMFPNLP